MAKSTGMIERFECFERFGRLDVMDNLYMRCREAFLEELSGRIAGVRGGNTISSGMMSGTICEGDADCSDATGADSAPAAAADDDDGGDSDPEPARRQPSYTHPQAIAPLPARASERRTATATAGDQTLLPQNLEIALWRLPTVLRHVPVSRSGWWAGVRDGRYPQPVRLSARCVAWRASDIRSLIESL